VSPCSFHVSIHMGSVGCSIKTCIWQTEYSQLLLLLLLPNKPNTDIQSVYICSCWLAAGVGLNEDEVRDN
jgi:hypothetical protein